MRPIATAPLVKQFVRALRASALSRLGGRCPWATISQVAAKQVLQRLDAGELLLEGPDQVIAALTAGGHPDWAFVASREYALFVVCRSLELDAARVASELKWARSVWGAHAMAAEIMDQILTTH